MIALTAVTMGVGGGATSVAVPRVASTATRAAMEAELAGTGLARVEAPTSAYVGIQSLGNLPTVAHGAATASVSQC